jgi:signal transduction histidine kinase
VYLGINLESTCKQSTILEFTPRTPATMSIAQESPITAGTEVARGRDASSPIAGGFAALNLAQTFNLTVLLVFVISGLGIGWWVNREIESHVVERSAATTAIYVENFLAPQLQDLTNLTALPEARIKALGGMLRDTPLGSLLVQFKVWGRAGLVLYSSNAVQIGRRFAVEEDLGRAWQQGLVSAGLSSLDRPENVGERKPENRLLETYVPVRERGTDRVIAVLEFYARIDGLEQELWTARWQSWLVVGLGSLLVYLVLIGLVRRASTTIIRQRNALSDQVLERDLLLERNQAMQSENQVLNDRVRLAATRTAELNERYLRRVSAELHDGPAQDLSFALLRLDDLNASSEIKAEPHSDVIHSLNRAVNEIRSIAGGLRLPELEPLTLRETLERAKRDFQNRCGGTVTLELLEVPDQVPLPVKITLFRVMQEALANGFRHGHGLGQRIRLEQPCEHTLRLTVSDEGPGFHWDDSRPADGHLGLIGMRERVESLGGTFSIEQGSPSGTIVQARIPIRTGSR